MRIWEKNQEWQNKLEMRTQAEQRRLAMESSATVVAGFQVQAFDAR